MKIHVDPDQQTEKVVLEKPESKLTRHLRPLYMKVHMEGHAINQLPVDNEATVNLLSANILKNHKDERDLIPTEVTINNFFDGVIQTKSVSLIELTVDNYTTLTAFFIVKT